MNLAIHIRNHQRVSSKHHQQSLGKAILLLVIMYYMDPTYVVVAVYCGWARWRRGGVVDEKHHASVKGMM